MTDDDFPPFDRYKRPQSNAASVNNAPRSETELLFAIRDALILTGRVLLWRNNSGRMQDARGRWVQFGLGLGSPDLVGILKPHGRLLGVEVKMPGKHAEVHQASWHRAAREAGALVIVAHSVEEAIAGLPEDPCSHPREHRTQGMGHSNCGQCGARYLPPC